MSFAVAFALLSAFGGLLVLFLLVRRLWRQVKSLAHTVAESGERIALAGDTLEAAQTPARPGVHSTLPTRGET